MFKKKTGTPIFAYLNTLRINKAIELLALGQTTKIYEIARAVGYSDEYYFSTVFKKQTGMSPKKLFKIISNRRNNSRLPHFLYDDRLIILNLMGLEPCHRFKHIFQLFHASEMLCCVNAVIAHCLKTAHNFLPSAEKPLPTGDAYII